MFCVNSVSIAFRTERKIFHIIYTHPSNFFIYDKASCSLFDQVASSLNSSYCYILHSADTVFTWFGSLATSVDQELAERLLDLIKVCQVLLNICISLVTFLW